MAWRLKDGEDGSHHIPDQTRGATVPRQNNNYLVVFSVCRKVETDRRLFRTFYIVSESWLKSAPESMKVHSFDYGAWFRHVITRVRQAGSVGFFNVVHGELELPVFKQTHSIL